jgi:hypothetical protein
LDIHPALAMLGFEQIGAALVIELVFDVTFPQFSPELWAFIDC